jgi:hypothetical protein
MSRRDFELIARVLHEQRNRTTAAECWRLDETARVRRRAGRRQPALSARRVPGRVRTRPHGGRAGAGKLMAAFKRSGLHRLECDGCEAYVYGTVASLERHGLPACACGSRLLPARIELAELLDVDCPARDEYHAEREEAFEELRERLPILQDEDTASEFVRMGVELAERWGAPAIVEGPDFVDLLRHLVLGSVGMQAIEREQAGQQPQREVVSESAAGGGPSGDNRSESQYWGDRMLAAAERLRPRI